MKKNYLFLMLLGVYFTYTIQAQVDYELTVFNEPYENLENPTSLNNGAIWDDPIFTVPIGFDFQFGSNTINTLYFTDDALGGILFTNDTIGEAAFGAFGPVLQDIIDRGFDTGTSQSPLSFQLDGEPGSQILKVEWNNVGFFDEVTFQDFMNFQIWLYEEGNVIEYRYGPNEINDPDSSFEGLDGIQLALFPLLTEDGGGPLNQDSYILSGDPQNPELVTLSTQEEFEQAEAISLTGAIPDGTVYRFSSETLSITDEVNNPVDFTIYPNPSNGVFEVQSDVIDYKLQVYDVSGQLVMDTDSSIETYDISALSKGVYFVKVQSPTGVDTRRLIKN